MKAAIYARFSSELQNANSADDQLAACERFVEAKGGEVIARYKDEGQSGTDYKTRPGIQALLTAVRTRKFDTVIAEAVDRFGRDTESLANFRKIMDYAGVEILTINEGKPSRLEYGLKSLIGAEYIEELRKKTKRGQRAALERGRIPGGKCYGYKIDHTMQSGRCINEHEADIIREIFESYDRGVSVPAIARELNKRCVPGSRGGTWRANTIIGSKKSANGVLRNTLYAGYFLFDRNAYTKDPETEKRGKTVRPESAWLRGEFPELQIIDDDLWQRVQTRLANQSREYRAPPTKPKRLLSGKLRCGCCGSGYVVVNRDKVGCGGRKEGSCSNRRMAHLPDIEQRVLNGLREHLLSPEAIELALHSAIAELKVLRKAKIGKRRQLETELGTINRKLKRMANQIVDGVLALPDTIREVMLDLEARKRKIEIELASDTEPVIAWHPAIAERYRQIVDQLHSALRQPTPMQQACPKATGLMALAYKGYNETPDQQLARENAYNVIRQMIDEIRVFPDGPDTDKRGGGPVILEVHGQMAALLSGEEDCRSRLVAGVGFEPTTFRL
jgi:site-specific DNA recombinase